MNKPLQGEIEKTQKIINDQFSHMKTSCKAFVAFFQQLNSIQKTYTDGLNKLCQTTGDKIGLKESLNGCKQFENPTICQLIDNTLGYLIRISDLISAQQEKTQKQVIEPIFELYQECKSMKNEFLNAIQQDIKKQRDKQTEKYKKSTQNLITCKKKASQYGEQKIKQMELEMKQLEQQNLEFEKESLNQLEYFLDRTETQEKNRTNDLKKFVNNFINRSKENIDNQALLTSKVQTNLKNIQINLDTSDIVTAQSMVKEKLEFVDFGQTKRRRSLKVQDYEENDKIQTKIQEVNQYIQDKRITNNKRVMYQSFVARTVPRLLKENEGSIYHPQIPYNDELQSIEISGFQNLLMALICNYTFFEKNKDKDRKDELEFFEMHTKNKLQISMNNLNQIKNFYTAKNDAVKTESQTIPNIFNSLFQKMIQNTQNPQTVQNSLEHPQNSQFHQKFYKFSISLCGINQYWKSILLPECLGNNIKQNDPNNSPIKSPQSRNKIQQEIAQINSIITKNKLIHHHLFGFSDLQIFKGIHFSENSPSPQISNQQQNLIDLTYQEGEFTPNQLKITYPLNYTMAKFLLNSVIDQENPSKMFIDDWEEHIEILLDFVEKTLNIPKANFYLLFISYAHELFIHRGLIMKENTVFQTIKGMKDFLTHASQSIQEAQAIKTSENFEMEPNQNKLNSYIRFIISDKPFQEITNIFKSFWEYLPSDINIINPLINYFFCLASNQINYTHFENFNQLTDYVFGSAGYKFGISYYKKCKFDPNQNYDIQTLAKISDILQRQNKDLPQIYMGFIPHIAHSLSPLLFTSKKDIEADLDIKFIENMVEEIIKVLELISEEQIIDDENGQIFNICLELSKLDDILNQCDQTRVLNYYQVLGKALNTWLIKFDDNQKEILYKCLQNEKWDHSEGNKIYTDIVIDYCSLLFKSVDMLKQILSISKENEFKKLIQNKLQAQILKAVKTYKEFVKKSLKNLVQPQNDPQQQFVQYTGKPTQLIYLTEDQQIHNLTIFKSLCYRLGNLNFIEEQLRVGYLQHFKQDKQIVVQIEESFKETEQYCCNTIAYNLVHVFLKESFCEHLYSEFDSQFFNSVMVEKFQVQYPKSFTNLTHELDDYMKMIKKRIPKQIIPKIGVEIINNIGIVFQRATVDLNKLDLPIDHVQFSQFLYFEINYLKQYFSENFGPVEEIQIQIAKSSQNLTELCSLFDQDSNNLILQFDSLNVQDDVLKSATIYRILYMRRKDTQNKRLQDIIKKFKKMYLGL